MLRVPRRCVPPRRRLKLTCSRSAHAGSCHSTVKRSAPEHSTTGTEGASGGAVRAATAARAAAASAAAASAAAAAAALASAAAAASAAARLADEASAVMGSRSPQSPGVRRALVCCGATRRLTPPTACPSQRAACSVECTYQKVQGRYREGTGKVQGKSLLR